MSAAKITKATLPAVGSASSTAPKFAAAHEAHIHHHRGIIGKVESVTHVFAPRRRVHPGFSDKLESKHDQPLHLEFEAEHGLGGPLGGLGAGPGRVGGNFLARE